MHPKFPPPTLGTGTLGSTLSSILAFDLGFSADAIKGDLKAAVPSAAPQLPYTTLLSISNSPVLGFLQLLSLANVLWSSL